MKGFCPVGGKTAAGQALLRANYSVLCRGQASARLEAALAHLLCSLMASTLAAALYGGYVSVWTSLHVNSALAVAALVGQWTLPPHVNRRQPAVRD